MLQIKNLSMNHTKDSHVLSENLSFVINEGDKAAIIGEEGNGKSTLLKLISRITAPSSGCIKLKGRVSGMLEIGAGFNGELTGREEAPIA